MAGAEPTQDEGEQEDPGGKHRPRLPFQAEVKHFYEGEHVQRFIAGLIIANFLIVCTQKEIDPQITKHNNVWYSFDVVFNVIFLVELIVNLYGRWWCEFWHSNWNRFDFTVVSIGVIDLAWTDMPAQLRLIRMLRAFRVFRLFAKVESMRRIIESIAFAVPGVFNAFLINFILICIFAVLSVDFFSTVHDDCHRDGVEGPPTMTTSRGLCWGYDYYGTFSRALYTMFQVLTGESWSEAGARPALNYFMAKNDMVYVVITYCFFYSFVIINSFVLLNVVVAVLMDGMNAADKPADKSDAEASEDRKEVAGAASSSEPEDKSDAEESDGRRAVAGADSGCELDQALRALADIQKEIKEQSAELADLRRKVDEAKAI